MHEWNRRSVVGWNSPNDEPKPEWSNTHDFLQYLKRAGFVGMRGKKMAEDDEDGFALNKRAGFVGMRGKKWSFWSPRDVKSNISIIYFNFSQSLCPASILCCSLNEKCSTA